MITEKKIMCRLCKNKIKGEALYAVHKSLCIGPGSLCSVILSNVNNYGRPGRVRCSQHHRYRPSADRPHRSKSVPPKGITEGRHTANTGASLTCHPQGRVGVPAARCKRRIFRSKSISPPQVNGELKSGARSRRRLLSGTRRLDGTPTKLNGTPTKLDACADSPRSDSAVRSAKDSRDLGLCDGMWEQTPIRTRSKSIPTAEDDRSCDQSKNCASPNSPRTNLSTDQSSPTSSMTDSAKKTRLDINDYKPFFFDSESVPPSLEVARRRFHRGRRGYFCCEIGCSCRKCHYFSLSLSSGRQYPFLRRCDAVCPCVKCHLSGSGKSLSSSNPGKSPSSPALGTSKKSTNSPSATLEDHQSTTSASSPDGVPHWNSPQSVGRRSHGHWRRGVASCRSVDAKSRERKDLSETESASPGRRRRREKKVCYHCGPCSTELHSWYSIRKHIMSSEHLQTVKHQRKPVNVLKRNRGRMCKNMTGETLESTELAQSISSELESPKDRLMAGLNLVKVIATRKDKDKTSESCDATLDKNCGVPLEPVAIPEATGLIEGASGNADLWPVEEGNAKRTSTTVINLSSQSSPVECSLQSVRADCLDNTSLMARPKISLGSSPMKLMLRHYAQSKANHQLEGQKSTFVRIDYKKKNVPVSSHYPSGTKSSVVVSEEGQRASLTPRLHPSNLPTPFVDLGERCDSAGWTTGLGSKRSHETAEEPPKKMIRMDYHRKPSTSVALSSTPSFGSLTYLSSSDGGDKGDRCPSPSSSIKSLVDEEALGERLILYDSDPDESKEVLRDFGMLAGDESGDQIVMLDSQKFLSRLIGRLNDGGLCCQSCGGQMDGNSIMSQLYNCSGKPQPQGRLNDEG